MLINYVFRTKAPVCEALRLTFGICLILRHQAVDAAAAPPSPKPRNLAHMRRNTQVPGYGIRPGESPRPNLSSFAPPAIATERVVCVIDVVWSTWAPAIADARRRRRSGGSVRGGAILWPGWFGSRNSLRQTWRLPVTVFQMRPSSKLCPGRVPPPKNQRDIARATASGIIWVISSFSSNGSFDPSSGAASVWFPIAISESRGLRIPSHCSDIKRRRFSSRSQQMWRTWNGGRCRPNATSLRHSACSRSLLDVGIVLGTTG